MVSLRTLVVTALVAVASAKSAVIDLVPSNFDDVVLKSGKPTLVKFFAPWCGHCKTLAPVYEELAAGYEHADDKVQIAKVDADAERTLGKRFGIQGFPTLKWFDGVSDTPHEYSGARSLDDLASFVEQKSMVKIRKKWSAPSAVQMLND
ncbi:Protein disulfide-isomerase erp38, partial [Ceratocystis pirilliformis]